ncbi:hypothetical protein KY311_03580 [Candidatus Woesearchaeota archaeon]|nr:hypothetical protein [Candidatus Woesearchaeota archaeon]
MANLEEIAKRLKERTLYDSYNRYYEHKARHQEIVSKISYILAEKLGLSASHIEDIAFAALFCNNAQRMWDDEFVNKPKAELRDEDRALIRLHAHASRRLLQNDLECMVNGFAVDRLQRIYKMIDFSHETYTPTDHGYPCELFGEDIPIGSRILLVAQSYVEMRCHNEYRSPWERRHSHRVAFEDIVSKSGTQYCPKVIAKFKEAEDVIANLIPEEF